MTEKPSKKRIASLRSRRLEAGKLFEKGLTQAQVARELGVTRVSAMRWFYLWKKKGMAGLIGSNRLGRKPRLTKEFLNKIERALVKGPQSQGYKTDLWTLPRIAEVVYRETGIRFHSGHVWRLLRAMNWSRQRPTTRAVERNEEEVARWVKTTWRRAKKNSRSA
jgi:transposase